MHYRAFYTPNRGKYKEQFVDALELDQLPAGALLVVQVNDDGSRELISEKDQPTPKERVFLDFGKRYLEFKHDGGPTPEMILQIREHRG